MGILAQNPFNAVNAGTTSKNEDISPGKLHDLPWLFRESLPTRLCYVFFLACVLAPWLSTVTFHFSPAPFSFKLLWFGIFLLFHYLLPHPVHHQAVSILPSGIFQIVSSFLSLVFLNQAFIIPCHNYCKRFPVDFPVSTLVTLQSLLCLAAIVLSLPCQSPGWSPCSLRRLTLLTIIWPLLLPSGLSLLQHWTTHSSQHSSGLTFFPLAHEVSHFVNTVLSSWLSFLHISRFISVFLSFRKMSLCFSPWQVTCSFSGLPFHCTSKSYIITIYLYLLSPLCPSVLKTWMESYSS